MCRLPGHFLAATEIWDLLQLREEPGEKASHQASKMGIEHLHERKK